MGSKGSILREEIKSFIFYWQHDGRNENSDQIKQRVLKEVEIAFEQWQDFKRQQN